MQTWRRQHPRQAGAWATYDGSNFILQRFVKIAKITKIQFKTARSQLYETFSNASHLGYEPEFIAIVVRNRRVVGAHRAGIHSSAEAS